MNMLDRQLECARINWLHQQDNVAQNINFTHHRQPAAGYDMPELAAMFEKSSGEPDMFVWHSNPLAYVGDDNLKSLVDFVEPGAEFRADKVVMDSGPWVNLCSSKTIDCQVAVKETSTMEVSEVAVLDNEGDDDWFFIDDFDSFAESSSSGERKAAFPLAEGRIIEERTEVAAMESLGYKNISSKNEANTSKASENKKLGIVRGRFKCPVSLSLAEKKRRQKIHDKLQCLSNMIPWRNKDNKCKTDLLDEIISYLKYLENQYLYFQLLLAKPCSRNNRTPVIKPNNFTAKKMSPPAGNAYFGYPAQQVTVNFTSETERQLAFASQVASWGFSTSALSIPEEQYVHGPSSFALSLQQELPIIYDPKTLSLLHQSYH